MILIIYNKYQADDFEKLMVVVLIFNLVETSLTFLVITLGTLVHGIAGFGVAQVSMGLMPLFRSPTSASIN
ncbi:hypothetical protein [Halanaerobium sp.]|uniref:hypothetical protein n=1 Tax=Halanaerobium sp. TaxID=1895664 RepID=UPI000DE605D2|nr:hypothetical protein [Halanaerobium sp.]PUU89658.1 MAG: hypothetical protein CI947_1642 [Halanaerobium sp.]PUU90244.1 MAG: hypothetical protein CI949_2423 [Halanaerobium sp.]